MTAPDRAMPRRCTCPHFENEHDDPHGPEQTRRCRACDCADFTARPVPEPPTRELAAVGARRAADPQAISTQVLAIRDRARENGRVVSPAQQLELDQTRRQREDEARRRADRERWLPALDRVPVRFRATPAALHPEVARWVADVKRGATESLCLLGGVGTGKTTQGSAAWAELVQHGVGRPEWVTVPDLLDSLRPGREQRIDLQAVQQSSLLLADDLAAERDSDWTTELLYRLLDYRYAWCLPTIVTSNVPPPEIAARLGDRIASRLAGMCRTVVLEGPDRRRAR